MRTTWRSCLPLPFVAASLATALLFAPGLRGTASAQIQCNAAAAPQCDGACPPGTDCEEQSGVCVCKPGPDPCGVDAGPPLCYGECPPLNPICADVGGTCACIIPTLSEWGIIGMSLVMFGGVLVLRRRRAPRT